MTPRKDRRGIVEPRDFNTIKLYESAGILVKRSECAETLESEKAWYRELPRELEFLHPRIFEMAEPGRIDMEYLDYPTAHELYMRKETSAAEWLDIFLTTHTILEMLAKERYTIEIGIEESEELIREMYIEKTEKRLNELAKSLTFKPMYLYDVEINGRKYISIAEMIDAVKRHAKYEIGYIDKAPIIHGDMHLGNMLISSKGVGVKLIDPRGKFGKHVLHGDQRYELAKLMHSVEGRYDLIIEDEFSVKHDPQTRSIQYRFNRRRENRKAEWAFAQIFGEKIARDRKALTIIEALLFLSMIPLHTESQQRQLVMLARGYELMEKALGPAYVRI